MRSLACLSSSRANDRREHDNGGGDVGGEDSSQADRPDGGEAEKIK